MVPFLPQHVWVNMSQNVPQHHYLLSGGAATKKVTVMREVQACQSCGLPEQESHLWLCKKQSESYACSHSAFFCFQNCEWPVGRCSPESQVLRFPSWDVSIQQQVPFPNASMVVSSQLSLDSAVSGPPFLCCSCPGRVRRRPITVLSQVCIDAAEPAAHSRPDSCCLGLVTAHLCSLLFPLGQHVCPEFCVCDCSWWLCYCLLSTCPTPEVTMCWPGSRQMKNIMA